LREREMSANQLPPPLVVKTTDEEAEKVARLIPLQLWMPLPRKVQRRAQNRIEREYSSSHTSPFPDVGASSSVDFDREFEIG